MMSGPALGRAPDPICGSGGELLPAAGWELAASPPGQVAGPPDCDAMDWRPIARPGPVAAMRVIGQGSEDLDRWDWWYRLRLRLDDPQADALWLDCEGLAGECELWFNGVQVGRTANMHLRHGFELRAAGAATEQTLLLCFRSLHAALQLRRPRPRWRVPMLNHQQLRWFRTSLLGRTPGWSPPWPPIGPWRPMSLRARRAREAPAGDVAPLVIDLHRLEADFDAATARGHLLLALQVGSAWPVRSVEVRLTALPAGEADQAGVRGADPGEDVAGRSGADASDEPAGAIADTMCWPLRRAGDSATGPQSSGVADTSTWHLEVDVGLVQAWWPHTHGEPVRHRIRLRIETEDGRIHERAPGPVTAIGFRRIERQSGGQQPVVQRSGGGPDGEEPAAGFALKVNGVEVFCRGACWTPADPLGWHEDAHKTEALLETACAGGLNMLRIMGTMVYEGPAFHEACDRLGILVWQDLMFANMDLPFDDPGFMALVEPEVAQQLGALIGRPSLAVVCGNSEVAQQAAMWGAPAGLWEAGNAEAVLQPLVRRLLPAVCWWPSSAAGGAFPHQVDAGTCSYYGVGAYRRPLTDARHSGLRFATECLAFAQVPGAAGLARIGAGSTPHVHDPRWKAGVARDLGAGWDFDDVRDHYLASQFGVDPAALRSREPDRYLRLSAAVTGEVMRRAFADWRRAGSACGGALVLWLRDLQPGAGWGLFDEQGEAKPVWHRLAGSWQPLSALITDEGNNGLVVQLRNEGAAAFQGRLAWQACRRSTRVAGASVDVALAGRGARSLPLSTTLEAWMDLNGSYGFGPPAHDAVFVELIDEQGRVRAQDAWFLSGPVLAVDPGLGLRASARQMDDQTVEIDVMTDGLAAGVRLEVQGHVVEDDGFHLAPATHRTVRARRRPDAGPFWRASIEALNGPGPVNVPLVESGQSG